MIDREKHRSKEYFLLDCMMSRCSSQCVRQTLYGILIGVSPIILCLLLLGIMRIILHHLEIIFNRRQKTADRRTSSISSPTGRLVLSYTPVSHAELQRIIQGEHKSNIITESSRKTPRFIKSILPKRDPSISSTSVLANLVLRRDAIDPDSLSSIIAPITTQQLQPTFSIATEKESRRASLIVVTQESSETTKLEMNQSNRNLLNATDSFEVESVSVDPLITTTQTTTTTTVVVEEYLDFHSVNSLPCALNLFNSADDTNDEKIQVNIEDEQEFV